MIEPEPKEVESYGLEWWVGEAHIKISIKELTDRVAFDTSSVAVRQTASHILLERFFAESRFLVLDSPNVLKNLCHRAAVAREQIVAALGRARERAS